MIPKESLMEHPQTRHALPLQFVPVEAMIPKESLMEHPQTRHALPLQFAPAAAALFRKEMVVMRYVFATPSAV
jgi:hypothetical protein